nr:putative integron gene cassette protein [uncultured bacterium]
MERIVRPRQQNGGKEIVNAETNPEMCIANPVPQNKPAGNSYRNTKRDGQKFKVGNKKRESEDSKTCAEYSKTQWTSPHR